MMDSSVGNVMFVGPLVLQVPGEALRATFLHVCNLCAHNNLLWFPISATIPRDSFPFLMVHVVHYSYSAFMWVSKCIEMLLFTTIQTKGQQKCPVLNYSRFGLHSRFYVFIISSLFGHSLEAVVLVALNQ